MGLETNSACCKSCFSVGLGVKGVPWLRKRLKEAEMFPGAARALSPKLKLQIRAKRFKAVDAAPCLT